MLPETRFLVSLMKGKQCFVSRLKRDCVRLCVCVYVYVDIYECTYEMVCVRQVLIPDRGRDGEEPFYGKITLFTINYKLT